MLDKAPPFQDYTALSDKIYLLEPDQHEVDQLDTAISTKEPTTIIIFGWGDGQPKHIAKYADGYHKLYPTSRIIVVLCTLVEAMINSIDTHTQSMRPVLDGGLLPQENSADPDRILVQIMSNSGAVGFIATILAHRATRLSMGEADPKPFAHTLLVCDSVPGGFAFWENVMRWSRALALASTAWAPLPVVVMQALWGVFLVGVEGLSSTAGRKGDQVGRMLAEGIQDPNLMSTATTRLYLYSKSDELIRWEDVEEHVAVAREKGYRCIVERFEDSPHVGHMRMYPDRYWDAIARAWESAVADR